MSDIAHQTSLIDDDDLFTRPPRSARRQAAPPIDRTARRQCRACNGSYVVPIDYDRPPFCPDCLLDLDATRARIRAWLDGISDQQDVAADTWLAFAAEHADDWDRLCKARAMLSAEDFARRAERHHATGNTYSKLLDAEKEYQQALSALQAERARLERALEALDG